MSAALTTAPDVDFHADERLWGRPRVAPQPSGCRWFVVASKPNAERRAHAALHLKGYQPYLPLITVRLPNRHYHTRPLFQGYLFVQLDLAHPWYPIKYAPGVFNLLCTNGIPAPCPVGAVEALQAAEAVRGLYPPTEQPWRPGQPCRLDYGPYDGVDAVVLKTHKDRVLIAMMMFGHLREVAVDADCLRARDE